MSDGFKQRSVIFDWPFSNVGTVRFFESVGPFHTSQWGDKWRVRDERKANHRGGPDSGTFFDSREKAWEFVSTNR